MIYLSIGMPRAGSGWHYNLTHDLGLLAGATDAREIRRRYRLQSILTEVNCNIGVLSARRLGMIMIPHLRGETFTIKLHAGPTKWGNRLISRGVIVPTYIYRDPRDALLSAYEYGARARLAGKTNAFSHLLTIEDAIAFIAEYVGYAEQWLALPHCHALRYEDLKADYDHEAARLAEFLQLDPASPEARTVIEKYRPEQAARGDKGLHFVKGVSGRYREQLTAAQQELCRAALGDALARLGYAPPGEG
jgi:hypothetical protein